MSTLPEPARAAAAAPPVLVNLGCGGRFHTDWLNFDLQPADPRVRAADFLSGIPLPDGTADCVYHSHVLEHLPLPMARTFLVECRRVLKPGGVLRVVVPDLEQSARDYVALLDERRAAPTPAARAARRQDHRWLLIEMFDQMVRDRPGGEFTAMLAQDVGNDDFVAPRIGAFGHRLIAQARVAAVAGARPGRFVRALSFAERWLPHGRALAQGLFRTRGEVHMWMYDELFLADLLADVGFEGIARHTAATSNVPNFAGYGLDAEPDGTPWKGVSLYMEGRKPG